MKEVSKRDAKKLTKLCGILTANTGSEWDWLDMNTEYKAHVTVEADHRDKLNNVRPKFAIAYLKGALYGRDEKVNNDEPSENPFDEPMFKEGDRVRVKDQRSEINGAMGIVLGAGHSVSLSPSTYWRVHLDKPSDLVYIFAPENLELLRQEDEKPFTMGDTVRIKGDSTVWTITRLTHESGKVAYGLRDGYGNNSIYTYYGHRLERVEADRTENRIEQEQIEQDDEKPFAVGDLVEFPSNDTLSTLMGVIVAIDETSLFLYTQDGYKYRRHYAVCTLVQKALHHGDKVRVRGSIGALAGQEAVISDMKPLDNGIPTYTVAPQPRGLYGWYTAFELELIGEG